MVFKRPSTAKLPPTDGLEGARATTAVDLTSPNPQDAITEKPSPDGEDVKCSTNSEGSASDLKDATGGLSGPNGATNGVHSVTDTSEKQDSASSAGVKRTSSKAVTDEESIEKKPKDSPQVTATEATDQPTSSLVKDVFPSPLGKAATRKDKEQWQGFCEIENEPAFFSVILREIGVRGVCVRQVVMLDPDILATMPNPIFGLILCYRHREFDVANQEEEGSSDIWFANQMPAQNSCATLAMIHTLMNTDSENVDIGEHMQQFKNYSMDLDPVHRGQAFASWQFVKRIHNSFAKKMDMLQNDEHLHRKATRAPKSKAKAKPKAKAKGKATARRASNSSDESKESFEENSHHYTAFVPVNGIVWKLDGMDRFPTHMGTYDEAAGESWTDAICDRIHALMSAGGDPEYSVFALAQSLLTALYEDIAVTDNVLKRVDRRLDTISTEWRAFVPADDLQPPSPSFLGSFTEEDRAAYPIPEDVVEEIEEEGLGNLLARRAELVTEFRRLVTAFQAEVTAEEDEDAAAKRRRFDYQPLIKRWLEMLAENGQLEELASQFPREQ